MNPDLIEYQKMIMAQQAQQPPRQYAPMQMPQSPMPQSSGNPIQMGAMNGMESAKHSLGMDAHERQRAMGHGMLKFFSQMGKTGHGPGLAGALSAINSSFLPGVEGFQAEENAVMNRNYTLMKQQQEMQRHAEQMAIQRMNIEEQRRNHSASHALEREKLKYLKDKLAAKEGGLGGVIKTEHGDIDLSQYPAIQTAAQKTLYAKKYDVFSNVTNDLNRIKETFNELSNATKDNVFAPLGSVVGSIPNTTKDLLARTAGDTELGKKLRKESMLRQGLESQFARLEPILERGLKGAAPDAQLLKRFHETKVYLRSSQPAYIIKDRLNELLKEAKSLQDSSRLSLLTGRQIPRLQAEEDVAEEGVPEHTNSVLQEMGDDQKQEIIAATRAKYPQFKEVPDDKILTWVIERPEKADQ
jgi:hypothetical protein